MSEEQAAEAAHQQSEKAEDGVEEKEVVEEGEGEAKGAEDGLEAMEEDEQQVTVTHLRLDRAACCSRIMKSSRGK